MRNKLETAETYYSILYFIKEFDKGFQEAKTFQNGASMSCEYHNKSEPYKKGWSTGIRKYQYTTYNSYNGGYYCGYDG